MLQSKNLLTRAENLLEAPEIQDSQFEFNLIKQAFTDLMYGVELEPNTLALILNKLALFSL